MQRLPNGADPQAAQTPSLRCVAVKDGSPPGEAIRGSVETIERSSTPSERLTSSPKQTFRREARATCHEPTTNTG